MWESKKSKKKKLLYRGFGKISCLGFHEFKISDFFISYQSVTVLLNNVGSILFKLDVFVLNLAPNTLKTQRVEYSKSVLKKLKLIEYSF